MNFSELYLNYYSKLVGFAREFVISEEDAKNIIQDVFTDLWERHDSIDYVSNINAYLFKLAKNKCLDYLKHKAFEERYAEQIQISFKRALDLQSLECFDIYDSDDKRMDILINIAINNLPNRCREIFILSRVENLKYKEISERLGLSVHTVKCQISIAFSRLRTKLNTLVIA
jgi:RNA polymerase sigma-70 factor (ECF subfamily)